MNQFRKIRDLLSNDKLAEAIDCLITLANSLDDRNVKEMAIMTQARLKRLENDDRNHTIEYEQNNIQRNKIMKSVLSGVNDLQQASIERDNEENEEDKILNITKTAIIIVELAKIKEEFNEVDWNEREAVLGKLFKFSEHNNIRVAQDVFSFLLSVAGMTRGGMTSGVASTIESLVIEFFPFYFEKGNENKGFNQITSECIYVGDTIFYDAAIHLGNLQVGVHGLQILKWIYLIGQERNIVDMTEHVNKTYQELEDTLARPERDDLSNAQELLRAFRKDLDTKTLAYPQMPEYLLKLVFPKYD